MILPHPRFRRQITEHMTLLLIFSSHAPLTTLGCGSGVVFQQPAKGRKSPDQVLPRGMSVEKVVADIGPQIAAMDKLITQCEERYGSRIKILDHPVLGPLTARQWRKFHLAHGRHHVKQIRQRRSAAAPR